MRYVVTEHFSLVGPSPCTLTVVLDIKTPWFRRLGLTFYAVIAAHTTDTGGIYLAYVIGVWCVLFPPSFPAHTVAPATAGSVAITGAGTTAGAGWISRRSEWFLQV
jgi:hypothetical protein